MCQKLLKRHCKIFNLKILKDVFFAAVMLNQPRTILQCSSCYGNSECCLCSFPVSHKDQKILKDANEQHVQISGDTSSTQLARIVTVLSRKRQSKPQWEHWAANVETATTRPGKQYLVCSWHRYHGRVFLRIVWEHCGLFHFWDVLCMHNPPLCLVIVVDSEI